MSNFSKIGFNFDNSYEKLPNIMLSKLNPEKVESPKVVIINYPLSGELGLSISNLDNNYLASLFSGNLLPENSIPFAQAYAGHQFGYFTMLGDGRAHILGEHLTPNNERVDIQFKGSGRTPYARSADGKAALGPMLREYIISESMHALGIPTTRSLAVVKTGEQVFRENILPGAILTRVAASHIRVGTFQYVAMKGDIETLKILMKYSINRHFSQLDRNDNLANLATGFLKAVMQKQIKLIIEWMRVGFIHGVMNTDNMTISGETIDYGPCAFMNAYNPETVFSSIDSNGRYAFFNQPSIAHWNLLRFAETLLPLINVEQKKAVEIAENIMNSFAETFKNQWIEMMKKKLGLIGNDPGDEKLITSLLSWMEAKEADYTNTFCFLMDNKNSEDAIFRDTSFSSWYNDWKKRLQKNDKKINSSVNLMNKANPFVIPRNHKVEEALKFASENNDLIPMNKLLNALSKPYENLSENKDYQKPPQFGDKDYKTFCGT